MYTGANAHGTPGGSMYMLANVHGTPAGLMYMGAYAHGTPPGLMYTGANAHGTPGDNQLIVLVVSSTDDVSLRTIVLPWGISLCTASGWQG